MQDSIFLNKPLQQDNVFVNVEMKSLQDLTGLPTMRGLSKAVVSEGRIVNVVSDDYNLVQNENFFLQVEEQLINADLNYVTRSINRDNRAFAVDYILSDESYHIDVHNSGDKLTPMLRFKNAYDGGPTSGSFGFFRQVCSNGLHICHSQIGFRVRHIKAFSELLLPNIKELVAKFMDNEFYTLRKKFEVLGETPIKDLSQFVKFVATEASLFKYETSEKNPDPSKNAQWVMDVVTKEARELGTRPNLWLGYNAFNEFIHRSEKKTFETQKKADAEVFSAVSRMAMAN